jgi:hypothetical protein
MAPNTQAVMMTLPPAKTGVGSAITSTTRNLGGVIGVAVFGSVAGSLFTSSMSAGRLPGGPAATQSISAAATVAQHLPGPQSSVLLHAAAHSFVHATGTASWVGAAVTLATVPVAFVCLPRRGGRK